MLLLNILIHAVLAVASGMVRRDFANLGSEAICIQEDVTSVVVYQILINELFLIDEAIDIDGHFTFTIRNAPISISTIVTATRTSVLIGIPLPTSIGTVDPLSPVIFRLSPLSNQKRQAQTSYVGAGGLAVPDCSSALEYRLSNGQLSTNGFLISTNVGVASQLFASSPTVGNISGGFSIPGNALVWADPSFHTPEGAIAEFCLVGGFLYAVFGNTRPSGCVLQGLIVEAAGQCNAPTASVSSQVSSSSTTASSIQSPSVPGTLTPPTSGASFSIPSVSVPPNTATTPQTTSVPATSSTSTSASPSGTAAVDPAFIAGMLLWHNYYRANNNASALSWSPTLAAYAQDYANKCVFAHSNGPYGENLAEGTFTDYNYYVYLWYAEQSSYNFASPNVNTFSSWGHFSQLVWQATSTLGCGYAVGCPGGNYLVCEYAPPGNLLTVQALQVNVAAPSSLNFNIPPAV